MAELCADEIRRIRMLRFSGGSAAPQVTPQLAPLVEEAHSSEGTVTEEAQALEEYLAEEPHTFEEYLSEEPQAVEMSGADEAANPVQGSNVVSVTSQLLFFFLICTELLSILKLYHNSPFLQINYE